MIQRVRLGELTQDQAGEVFGLSERQVRRLVKTVQLRRARGLVHGSRGKESRRKIPEDKVEEHHRIKVICQRACNNGPLRASKIPPLSWIFLNLGLFGNGQPL